MIDYNFFNDFEVTKVKKSTSARLTLVVCVLVVFGLIGYGVMNYLTLIENQADLKQSKSELAALRLNDDIIRIQKKVELEKSISGLVANIESAQTSLQNRLVVKEATLLALAGAMPIDMELSSYTVSGLNIIASGKASSKPAIAEFEYNLRHLEMVESAVINTIVRNESDEFSFGIDISLYEGGPIDENQ